MADPNSSVPPINWLPSGPVVPDESAIFDGVMADTNAAFGGGMNTTNLSSPQGQLAQSATAIIGAKNDDVLEVVNGMDPDKAAGRFQDGIGRIYFIDRNPAEPTTVTATCMGAAGTQIPVGTKAKATDGNFYMCTQAGTIPVSGTIDLQFACTVTGPIPCPANSLSVSQAIPGLDRITNSSAGILGVDVESRADFENRRQQSVAANSKGSVPSVRGAVLDVANVLDAYVTDNGLPTPVVIGGVTVEQNCLYVCAAGGAAQDIGDAIWTKKSPGCNTQGGTSVTVNDTDGYTPPYPQFTMNYDVASGLPIFFSVQIENDDNLPSNINQLVQQAIVNAFSGADGGQRARIGRRVLASRYYPGVENIDPSVELLSIQVGASSGNANFVNVNINQIPTLDPNNITITLV